MANLSERILIVDDDAEIRSLVSHYLARHGYAADVAADGAQMRRTLARGHYDLVVLDIMMPGEDGLSLCRSLRERSSLPVILLTALTEETDRVIGLEIGADDYITKPFGPRELLARIRAVLRRASQPLSVHQNDPAEVLEFGGRRLWPGRRELRDADDVVVSLTAGEFDLLLTLVRNPGRVLSRDELLDLTKGRSAGPFDRSIDIQMSRLRHKIEADPKAPTLIRTVRGGGYLLAAVVQCDRVQ
jgi:two-component system OmpR family response regulator